MKQLNYFLAILLSLFFIGCHSSSSNTEPDQKTKRNGKTLFFVHGWNLNGTYWDAQRAEFESDYNVVTPSISDTSIFTYEKYSIEGYANQIVELIETDQLDSVILIGHSMGGDIVLNVALQIPEKIIGVVGVDNFKDVVDSVSQEQLDGMDEFFYYLEDDYVSTAAIYATQNLFHPASDRTIIQKISNEFATAPKQVAIESLRSYMESFQKEAGQLQQLHTPLKLINSTFSPTNEKALVQFCKNGHTVHYIDSVGHFPMIENPEVFNKKLNIILENMF